MIAPELECSNKKNTEKRKCAEKKDATSNGKEIKSKKKKTAAQQIAESVNSFMEFQKKSDESHMKFMKEQASTEEKARKAEMKMHYELMGLLAKAVQPTSTSPISLAGTYPGTSQQGYNTIHVPTDEIPYTDNVSDVEKIYFQL